VNKIDLILEAIKEQGFAAETITTNKNGVEKLGVLCGVEKVRPTIYITEEMLEMKPEEAARKIIEIHKSAPAINVKEITETLLDINSAQENIYPCLMPVKDEKRVTSQYLDLWVYYRYRSGEYSVVIKPELLEKWEISQEELHEIATENLKKVITIKGFLNAPFKVVTTQDGSFGGSALLLQDYLAKQEEVNKTKFYIIPSTVHELLLIDNSGLSREQVDGMVQNVNQEVVSDEEKLSGHVYYIENGKVTY